MNNLFLAVVMVLTLGLAPYYPQPHIVKQITALASGVWLAPIDWFDLLMHGAPWVYLTVMLFVKLGRHHV